MNVALDTNAYTDFMRGDANRVSSNAANLKRFLASPRVSVLLPDEQTAHHYAQLHPQLRRQGTAIPTNDLRIAALVVQHDLILCASDRHFRRLSQVVTC